MSVTPETEAHIFTIQRPDPRLMTYYFIRSLAGLIFFPIILVPLFFKYHTLRYRFDADGISMSWGLLFRKEINLTYRRIQDIHQSRGIIERWLGIASLSIQTASGTAGAEMTIQGLREFEQLRDFLYSRMRGNESNTTTAPSQATAENESEALALLKEIHADLASIRQAMPTSRQSPQD